MTEGNFMDDLYVEDLNEFYLKTGFITVVQDGHAGHTFNENNHNQKGYEALTDYAKEEYRNLTLAEID